MTSGNQQIDKPTIINMALQEIGQPPSYSTDDESTLGGTADKAWYLQTAYVFSLHDWSFARRTSKLTQISGQPDNGWRYGFSMPGDRIGGPLKVLQSAGNNPVILREYMLEDGYLFANVPDVWAQFKKIPPPDRWDAGFITAFVTALASKLAVPVQQDEKVRDDYAYMAFGSPREKGTGGMFGRLIAQDRCSFPMDTPLGNDNPFTRERF